MIDKSVLALPELRRIRDREHVRYVTHQSCLICGRRPSDAHHLRFAQNCALSRKVSDEFTVPLCRGHHREVHRSGDEAAWWKKAGIDPSITARALWLETHPLPANTHRWPEKRLDDIEDRAVNVDPLPVILGKPLALLQLGDDRQVPGDPIFTRLFPCQHRPHCRVVIDRAWRELPARPPPHRAGHARKHRAGGSGPEMFHRDATKRKAAWKAAKA